METIEELIEKFKKLADEYANFVEREPKGDAIYMCFGDNNEKQMRLYFAIDGDYSITFEEVTINEWGNTITFPLNYTLKDLEKTYNDAKKKLDEKREIIKEKLEKAKEEIECLKKIIKELEKEIN